MTAGAGLYFQHYFTVSVFLIWVGSEFLLFHLKRILHLIPSSKAAIRLSRGIPGVNPFFLSLIDLFKKTDPLSEAHLEEELSLLMRQTGWNSDEVKWLQGFQDICRFRKLLQGKEGSPQSRLRALFIYGVAANTEVEEFQWSEADIVQASLYVAHLYERLLNLSENGPLGLRGLAKELLSASVSESDTTRNLVEAMQRDGGISYLLLNLIQSGRGYAARSLGRWVLSEAENVDEDLKSHLYWMSEMHAFLEKHGASPLDYESTIRHLYHLCFLEPDRAGYLEIDSQFFPQFDTVSEIAREGFLYKETLIEGMLELWFKYEGLFDSVFQKPFEKITRRKSKIYDERDTWEKFWTREKDLFGREYLYVVEGNICFASGHYKDAKEFYEKALAFEPGLRAARLNLLFALSKLHDKEAHEAWALTLIADRALYPKILSHIGNSFLLMNDAQNAAAFFEALEEHGDWKTKAAYYRSQFCHEHGLFELALKYAKEAFEVSPEDTAVSYHLSLCYDAVGEKDRALSIVEKLSDRPEWVEYYKFRLERDSGKAQQASQTLLQISSEYFEDPEELAEALEFAKDTKNLVLLRHLRNR
jgi:tetratricopeptide (TPR) repeat protein